MFAVILSKRRAFTVCVYICTGQWQFKLCLLNDFLSFYEGFFLLHGTVKSINYNIYIGSDT